MLGPLALKNDLFDDVAGFETPTNGEIYLGGNAISHSQKRYRYGFSKLCAFPHMTVYENLAFPLRVRKIPKDEADKKIDKARHGITSRFCVQDARSIVGRTTTEGSGSKIISV